MKSKQTNISFLSVYLTINILFCTIVNDYAHTQLNQLLNLLVLRYEYMQNQHTFKKTIVNQILFFGKFVCHPVCLTLSLSKFLVRTTFSSLSFLLSASSSLTLAAASIPSLAAILIVFISAPSLARLRFFSSSSYNVNQEN